MEKQKSKTWILALLGALVLVLVLIGGMTLAQDAPPEIQSPAPETESLRSLHGFDRWHGFGHLDGSDTWLENLAEALGMTVGELEAAQDRAYAATVADAVEAGHITQEQADQILAKHALQNYIDRKAILATALGMTTDELDAALVTGQSLSDLMEEKGIDSAELMANAQAAYEVAVQQAVTDGAITQAQADEFLSNNSFSFHGRGGRGSHHGGDWGRDDHRPGMPWSPGSGTPDTTTPDTTDTGFDA